MGERRGDGEMSELMMKGAIDPISDLHYHPGVYVH
jgi:hypothetical protein